MTATEVPLLLSLLVVCCPAGCALWVLSDARKRERRGHRVGVYFPSFQLDRPETWAIACLLLWILAFPLYLRARAES